MIDIIERLFMIGPCWKEDFSNQRVVNLLLAANFIQETLGYIHLTDAGIAVAIGLGQCSENNDYYEKTCKGYDKICKP